MKKLLLLIAAITLFSCPAYAWKPIANTTPQYVDSNGDPYSGAVLKAYSAGTSTNITLATDGTGATTATSMALNSDGYPEVSGSIVIPYVNEAYKLALYPTQTAADSDTGAIWTIDNISIGTTFGESSVMITSNTVLTSGTHCNAQMWVTGTTTLTLPAISSVANDCVAAIYNGGTSTVTLDGNSSETVNGATTWVIPPGGNGQLIAGKDADTSDWTFNGSLGIPQSLAAGDILYHSTTTGLTRQAIGTNGELLAVAGGLPGWRSFTDWPEGTLATDSEILFQSSAGTINFASVASIVDLTGLRSVQTFTTPGDTVWTRPAGVNSVLAIVIGAGGGGGGADSNTTAHEVGGGGGGGGGCAIEFIDVSSISSGQVTVGAAGTAGAGATGGNGGTGGTSGFIAFVSASGGNGGTGTGSAAAAGDGFPGADGGVGSGGDLNIQGGAGGGSVIASTDNALGGSGGSSCFGGGGRGGKTEAASNVTAPSEGGDYGGGGGGAADSTASGEAGGAGAPGAIYVLEFAN